jgi:flagellar protein FliO/FliZ
MVELILRIGVSLGVILALMWGLARLARKPLAARAGGAVAVLSRQNVSRHASVVVVRVADRALVLGVTEQQVTMLTETDLVAVSDSAPAVQRSAIDLDHPAAAAAAASAEPRPTGRLAGSVLSPHTWTQAITALRERTVRS